MAGCNHSGGAEPQSSGDDSEPFTVTGIEQAEVEAKVRRIFKLADNFPSRNTDDAKVHFNRALFAWWLVAIEGGVFFAAVFLTVFVYNLLTVATSIFFMLIYLICVGAVLQGDGNWLYDHWGDDTELHSAVLIETSGLVFTIIFSIPSTTMLYTVGIHFANRREQELSRYNFMTL